MAAKPLSSRWLDCLYLTFFLIHIPVMLLVDLTPLYTPMIHATFPFLNRLRTWYITQHSDPLFIDPPAWFALYTWMEALYHLPLSLWAVGALWDGTSPRIPVQLLVWATQTAVTTVTCIVEYESRSTISAAQMTSLGWLYKPYLALSILMWADMFFRVRAQMVVLGKVGRQDGAKGGKAL